MAAIGIVTLPPGARIAVAVVAGLAIAMSLPPFGFWPLGVLGLAALSAALRDRPPRSRAALGAAAGLGQYAVGLWWVTDFNVAGYLALLVLTVALTAAAAAAVPARRRFGVLVGLPAVLILCEWLRGHYPFGGLPIGGLALGQAAGPLAPVGRLGGTLLVTGTTALAGAALALLPAALPSRPPPSPPRRSTGDLAAGMVALLLVVGLVAAGRLGPDGTGRGPRRAIEVAAVQGGGPRGLHATETDPNVPFQRQRQASAALQPPLDLVVWPEDAVQLDRPVVDTPEGAAIAALAVRLRTTLVAGVVEDVGPTRFRNAAIAWSPTGTIVARFDKVHRVPFGEFIPGRALFRHLANVDLVPRDALAGHGPGLLDTPVGPLGTLISYEVFFEDRARAAIGAGGRVLVVPTNASSYRTSQVPTQQVAAAQLRAWETGRDLIQAAPTGYSALIGHNGRIAARSVLGRQQVVRGTLTPRTGRTVFVRIGDLPLLLLAMAGLGVATGAARRHG